MSRPPPALPLGFTSFMRSPRMPGGRSGSSSDMGGGSYSGTRHNAFTILDVNFTFAHSYVGNSVTTFVLQLLGTEVLALNTVQYSNHSGYRQSKGDQIKGYKVTAKQIEELYEGLKENYLDDFEMMLTGYVPGSEELKAVGKIGIEMKEKGKGCFWLLDPVLGDQERLYVSEAVVPVYESLLPYADLIVPNQFETELLSGIKVDSIEALSTALDTIHCRYKIPHIVITSVTFSDSSSNMKCAGSSITSTGASRKFIIDVPIIDGFFSGTGDMFAALTLARFREQADAAGLLGITSWLSPDDVSPIELPLAKAIEMVLASMHMVIEKTREFRDRKLEEMKDALSAGDERTKFVLRTKASELRLVQSREELLRPTVVIKARGL
ncbi:putative pyridoxal kinase [Rhizina undulata]